MGIRRERFGPGWIVAAAFIGPGTVTTATVAGAGFGLTLLWVLLFAVAATIILQEMSARLGLVTRGGLGEALRSASANRWLRAVVIALIVGAIGFGNAAFQTGNITGAAMGLSTITPFSHAAWACATGVTAAALLWAGTYRRIENTLITLVAVMSAVFVVTAVLTRPDLGALLTGLLKPTLPGGSLTTVVALIGTTVVPYNLFLHASSVCKKWAPDPSAQFIRTKAGPGLPSLAAALRRARVDTAIAVTLGGAVTLAIVVTAAAFFRLGASVDSASGMAAQLEPLLGRTARAFFAVGLIAAGLTSAITAPLAAAFAICGTLGWPVEMSAWRFRVIWLSIVTVGTVLAVGFHSTPVPAILFAQAANGIILPLIAVFLLVAVNRRPLMGPFANGRAGNVLGTLVVLIAAGLGISKLLDTVFAGLKP